MKIDYDKKFEKKYKKRIKPNKNLAKRYEQRLVLFARNKRSPVLRDHKLVGNSTPKRAFSITGDVRVIYIQVKKNHVIFLDVGTHSQVYGK